MNALPRLLELAQHVDAVISLNTAMILKNMIGNVDVRERENITDHGLIVA